MQEALFNKVKELEKLDGASLVKIEDLEAVSAWESTMIVSQVIYSQAKIFVLTPL